MYIPDIGRNYGEAVINTRKMVILQISVSLRSQTHIPCMSNMNTLSPQKHRCIKGMTLYIANPFVGELIIFQWVWKLIVLAPISDSW